MANFSYIYQYKDHLGNIRLSYKQGISDLEIVEENNYYPFGLRHKGYNNIVSANNNSVAHKYKYNNKELQGELGLDMYDYGARIFDTWTGRWNGVDPLAEKYPHISPYVYVANNPIKFIDPDGQRIVVASKDDREMLLGFLAKIYGEGSFSFNDNNELKFDGDTKKFKGDSKDTLKKLTGIIDSDYDVNVKLSNFSDEEKSLLEAEGGAYSSIESQTNKKGKFEKVLGANIFLDENRIGDLFLFEKKYRFRDADGFWQNVNSSGDVPEGISSETVYAFIYDKNDKPKTVTGGGGSVGIMHELFHVAFEGKNQRKINRYDNKVRRILGIPERSVDDPKHNYNKK